MPFRGVALLCELRAAHCATRAFRRRLWDRLAQPAALANAAAQMRLASGASSTAGSVGWPMMHTK